MASAASATDLSRQALEKAKTLPIAEARKSVLGLAKTQPLAAVAPAPAAQPRRIRPVAQLPSRPTAQVKPIAPVVEARPVAKPVTVAAPAVTARILPAGAGDDGWSQGRKRSRPEPATPLRPVQVAEGTQPGMNKSRLPAASPRPAGKHAAVKPTAPALRAVPAERPKLAEGSIPPPAMSSGKPLPSLFSVIDRKPPERQTAAPSRLPGLPPPSHARSTIGPKKAVSTVVAAASLGSAQLAIAATRQTGEHALVPPPAHMVLDEDMIEEIEEIEEDLPDFVPVAPVVAAKVARAAAPTPLFDAPPRQHAMGAATSFSAAERAFFAAGEEMDTLDMDSEQETFDDLPGIERPSFWSRLKNRASAGH